MKIEYLATKDIIPYEKNAKKHPKEQIDAIVASIKEFNIKQPLVVDANNVLVIGHGRLQAIKKLKIAEVPVVRADDLTDEQISALRLADNKTNELGEWDNDILNAELSGITEIKMDDFGFDMSSIIPDTIGGDDGLEDDNDGYESPFSNLAPPCQHNVFDNMERMQFPLVNYYGIPELEPTHTTGDKFLRFMDWKEVDDPSEYIAHFYYDDYKFMSAWREPDKYLERLRQFKAVVAPDFSSYTDFPIVLQIMGAYRRNWTGAYWQANGIDIIPDVQWGNEETFKWCFEGIPKHATVAISSLGVANQKDWNGKNEMNMFKAGFDEMMKRLEPETILWYGNKIDGCEGNIIHIPSYYEEKRAGFGKKEDSDNGKG